MVNYKLFKSERKEIDWRKKNIQQTKKDIKKNNIQANTVEKKTKLIADAKIALVQSTSK